MPDLRAVVFDAVGTLMTPDPPVREAYHRIGRRYGSRRSRDEVGRRFTAAFRGRLSSTDASHRTDENAERTFWRSVVATVFDELPDSSIEPCFLELFEHFANPLSWRVYDDVEATLRQLLSRGKTVAVASNFDSRLHAVFERHPTLATIERRFVSSQIGWRKPDKRFFTTVCQALRCDSREVLYVGDEPLIDVAAATDAGLSAVLLRREGPLVPGVLTNLQDVTACCT